MRVGSRSGTAAGVLRAARWLLLAVPLADRLLVATGLVGVPAAVAVRLGFEVLLAGVLVVEVAVFRRAFRAARGEGAGRWAAAATGLAAALPPPVVWLVRTEVGMGRALCWAVRDRRAVSPDDVALPYTDRIAVLLWMTVGLGALETMVVHVVVPWRGLRWVLLALSLYGLAWVAALVCSLRQHPHVLRDGELLLRFGHFRTTPLPLETLVSARSTVQAGHRRNIEVRDGVVALSVAGETNVEVAFDPPVVVAVKGRSEPASRVRFFADDPRTAVRLLTGRRAAPGADRAGSASGG